MWPILKQKVRAVLPKPKLIVYIGRFKNSEFENSEFGNSEFNIEK